jgi:L-lysine exporter family protein LysE/ArgO
MHNTLIFIQGFITCMGLIMVIGSQNAFILRHGVQRNYVFMIATVSLLGDVVLITLGVNGLGTLVQSSQVLQLVAVIGGSIFLISYGATAFYAAWQKKVLEMHMPDHKMVGHRLKLIMMALGFSILNPHAWLDAAVILGSIGGQLESSFERHIFTIGALIGSAVRFYSLALMAWKLAPYLRKQRVWQVINISIGCMMWLIAANLIWDYLI